MIDDVGPFADECTVVIGGLIMSFAHSAACDFVRRTLPNKNHQQANHSTIRFFRPVFATPQKLTVAFKVVNVTKSVSTLHFQVLQNGKVCDVGYIRSVLPPTIEHELTHYLQLDRSDQEGWYNKAHRMGAIATSYSSVD